MLNLFLKISLNIFFGCIFIISTAYTMEEKAESNKQSVSCSLGICLPQEIVSLIIEKLINGSSLQEVLFSVASLQLSDKSTWIVIDAMINGDGEVKKAMINKIKSQIAKDEYTDDTYQSLLKDLLMQAAAQGNLILIALLYEEAGLYTGNLLIVASAAGYNHLVTYLLSRGTSVDSVYASENTLSKFPGLANGQTPLMAALAHGQIDTVHLILSHNPNVRISYPSGGTHRQGIGGAFLPNTQDALGLAIRLNQPGIAAALRALMYGN